MTRRPIFIFSTEGKSKEQIEGMLNCKFGCDEFYERGFVSVDENWSVIVAPSLANATALAYVRDTIQTSMTPRPASVHYFAWHRQHHNFE